jgi:hypothetical protein
MPTFYVHPVFGAPLHAVIVSDNEWTMGVTLCDRFMPEGDARHQGYDLAYGPQPLWRIATKAEEKRILAEVEDDELAPQLYGVSGL